MGSGEKALIALAGLVVAVAFLATVWFPHSVAEWFVASLVPGFVAFRMGAVPEDYSPSRAFYFVAGVWLGFFWLPILVAIGTTLKLLS